MRELGEAFATRRISPVEVVDDYLCRIERLDGVLHCYVEVAAEQARAAARKAELEIARGRERSALAGIPFGVKDLIDVAGLMTTAASRAVPDRVAKDDAVIVSKLKHAGVVILGKLNLYEFGLGRPDQGDRFAATRNPWDTMRVSGGSSSGAAAGVAAGLCASAVATDSGGSTRNPAAYCGVVGLKPTYQLLSTRGVVSLAPSLDHVGLITRTVDDAALIMGILLHGSPWPSARSVSGTRVGVPRTFIESAAGVNDEIRAAFERSLVVLASQGCVLTDVVLPDRGDVDTSLRGVLLSEAAAGPARLMSSTPELYGVGFRTAVAPALAYSQEELQRARRLRKLIQHQVERVFGTVDIVATPTMPWTAPTIAEFAAEGATFRPAPYSGLFNLTGGPSISVPCGTDRSGLPIGMMLSGRLLGDRAVLGVARAYESARGPLIRVPVPENLIARVRTAEAPATTRLRSGKDRNG